MRGYIHVFIQDHSLFRRTRRAISVEGFLTTIHNIIDVAAAKAYLGKTFCVSIRAKFFYSLEGAHQVNIYCVWLFRRLTSAGLPIGIPRAARSQDFKRSGSLIL